MGFIWSIIIGIVAGYLAGKIMRGGGFGVMEQLNRVPVKGDSFAVQNLEITVSGLSAYRVSSVTVRQCGVCLACAQ